MPTTKKTHYTRLKAERFRCSAGKQKERLPLSDVSGLCIEAYISGEKRWAFVKKVRGSTAKFVRTLGPYENFTIEEAVEWARPFSIMCHNGVNPKVAEANAESASGTQAVTFDDFFSQYVARRSSSWSKWSVRDHNQAIAAPTAKSPSGGSLRFFSGHLLGNINRDVVEQWVASEALLRRPTTTAKARRNLYAALRWGLEQDVYEEQIDSRILDSRSIKSQTRAHNSRANDVIPVAKLPDLYSAIRSIPSLVMRVYLFTVLLTGCRKEEVMSLKWSYLEQSTQSTKINCKRDGRVDDGGGRSIPIGDWLWSQIDSLPRIAGNEFIFTSNKSSSGRLVNPSKAYIKARRAVNLELSIHGFRRVYSMVADELDIPAEIQHYLQGQSPVGVREYHYKSRTVEQLREYQDVIENFYIESCGIR